MSIEAVKAGERPADAELVEKIAWQLAYEERDFAPHKERVEYADAIQERPDYVRKARAVLSIAREHIVEECARAINDYPLDEFDKADLLAAIRALKERP